MPLPGAVAPEPQDDVATTVPPSVDTPEAGGGLSPRDLDILAFERHWWRQAGAKEQAVRERFGVSGTRYYQLLNSLLDRPEALAADPMVVKRLRRLRESRQRARALHGPGDLR